MLLVLFLALYYVFNSMEPLAFDSPIETYVRKFVIPPSNVVRPHIYIIYLLHCLLFTPSWGLHASCQETNYSKREAKLNKGGKTENFTFMLFKL